MLKVKLLLFSTKHYAKKTYVAGEE